MWGPIILLTVLSRRRVSKINEVQEWPMWLPPDKYTATLHLDNKGEEWYLIFNGYGFRTKVLKEWSNLDDKEDERFILVEEPESPRPAA